MCVVKHKSNISKVQASGFFWGLREPSEIREGLREACPDFV